jgi:HEAT repeat protein
MRRYGWITICLAVVVAGGTSAQTIPAHDIRSLMAQLSDIRTIRRDTAKEILEVARKDSDAREYVLQRLPEMIKSGTDEPWLNAVWLAGQLKATEAIPALQEAMSRPPFPAEPDITFAGEIRLANDIVARTLSQIGDPSIPSVVNLLKSADEGTRRRAVLILRNINSRAARKALQDRLPDETDPSIKKLIRGSLHP